MADKYRSEPANGGTKTVILDAWIVKAVCVDADHEAFAQAIVAALNHAEGERWLQEADTTGATQ